MSESRKGEKSNTWKGGISNLEVRAGRPKTKVCELCGRKSVKICFDHNHSTGKFRGWICTRCNVTLGMAGDDIDHLQRLQEYIKCDGIKNNIEMQISMYEEALSNKKLIEMSE